jgi:Carboxypeptidase regulatory-like domain/Divergent InlB B-repeat domain
VPPARILASAVLLVGTSLPVPARTHTVHGCVKDEAGAPVHGAIVYLEEIETPAKYTVATDGKGCFKQEDVPDGHFEVRAQLGGVTRAKKQVVVERAGSVTVDLQFAPQPAPSSSAPPMVNLKMLADTAKSKDGRQPRFDARARSWLLRSITFQPEIANSGDPAMGTVALSKPAPEEGVSVDLWVSNKSVATVPPEVVVPKGEMTASFPITTHRIRGRHDLRVTIKAADEESEKSAELQIRSFTRVSVRMSGAGYGRVTSQPAGIGCGTGVCTASFADGETVQLKAEPKPGSQFTRWSGACDQAGKVLVKGPMMCVAEFR